MLREFQNIKLLFRFAEPLSLDQYLTLPDNVLTVNISAAFKTCRESGVWGVAGPEPPIMLLAKAP